MQHLFLYRCSRVIISLLPLLQIITRTEIYCNCFQTHTTTLASSGTRRNKLSVAASSSKEEYTVTLHYENNSCDIKVKSDETLLSALERNHLALEQLGLPSHMIPSDCRRGNCLTCSGTHTCSSDIRSSVCDDDGLSPQVARAIQEKGYVLTCSTKVVGEGLELNLGENHNVWKDIYQDRFKNDEQNLGWAAMAKSIRKIDERNISRWQKKTEEIILRKDH